MRGNTLKPLDMAQTLYLVAMWTVILFLSITAAQAGQVTLAWNASSGPVVGYRVYYGTTSGSCDTTRSICNYTSNTPVGNTTTATVSNLTDGVRYYFAVTAYDSANHESGFSDEVNHTIPSSSTTSNIASLAAVTASTQNTSTSQQAVKAVDGVVDGYPGDHTREWATLAQGLGAWIELNWSTAYQIDRVVLHDRPNANDQITAATLTFGDGSSVAVGALANNGAATEIRFTPRVTSRVRLAVTTVSASTANVGLAEFAVHGAPVAASNEAPVANAGADQTVAEGATVVLDGSGSWDPNDDPLSYRWTRTAGPAVTLANATTATPNFIAPTGLTANAVLTFSLIVNDGQSDSAAADTVNITVVAANPGNSAPVANAGADQTVTAGATVALDGRASLDPDHNALSYRWTQTVGPAVTLANATTATPSFTAPTNQTANVVLTFSLVVNDGQLNSPADTVNITVGTSTPTSTPTASNIERLAAVTASSQNTSTSQQAVKAVDGVVDGYAGNPGDHTREWATLGERAGAWIELNWSTAYQIDRVVLHDRPNTSDRITGATLSFSNGSTVAVGALNDDGAATEIRFAPVTTSRVRLTVTSVSASTINVGLAEFKVFNAQPSRTDPLPSEWMSLDIGYVGLPGSAGYDAMNRIFTIEGSGADIWGRADAFHFACRTQTLTGDGSIVARVASMTNTHPWAKAGVMIRENLEVNARHAMVVVTPGNGVAFQRRTSTGRSSAHTAGAAVAAPYWVKLTRAGNTFTAFQSANGSAWTRIGSVTIKMATSAFVGLAVTSTNNSALNTATFDNVNVQFSQ